MKQIGHDRGREFEIRQGDVEPSCSMIFRTATAIYAERRRVVCCHSQLFWSEQRQVASLARRWMKIVLEKNPFEVLVLIQTKPDNINKPSLCIQAGSVDNQEILSSLKSF